jgi:hypothetical protein
MRFHGTGWDSQNQVAFTEPGEDEDAEWVIPDPGWDEYG